MLNTHEQCCLDARQSIVNEVIKTLETNKCYTREVNENNQSDIIMLVGMALELKTKEVIQYENEVKDLQKDVVRLCDKIEKLDLFCDEKGIVTRALDMLEREDSKSLTGQLCRQVKNKIL